MIASARSVTVSASAAAAASSCANTRSLIPVRLTSIISRAVTAAARLMIEVNLKGIRDPVRAEEFGTAAAVAGTVAERADAIVAAVRAEIAR